MPHQKLAILDTILKELDSFVVAFSGGVDSSFLLHRSHKVRKSIMAVTIRTPYIPESEINEAIEFSESKGIKHKILDLPFPDLIRDNPIKRCYLMDKITHTPDREYITEQLKKIGFRYVSLDLEGYRTGSSNPENKKNSALYPENE